METWRNTALETGAVELAILRYNLQVENHSMTANITSMKILLREHGQNFSKRRVV